MMCSSIFIIRQFDHEMRDTFTYRFKCSFTYNDHLVLLFAWLQDKLGYPASLDHDDLLIALPWKRDEAT